MVALQTGDMLFNGLDVIMTAPDPTYGYRIRVMDGATEFGDPEAVIADIQSQLQDGDLQRVDRFGNRTAILDLRIDAPGSSAPGGAVAAGQRAVELAANFTGWAELAWTSPMAGADTSVMEMTSAVVGKTLNTARETSDGTRIIKVTIGARPFVRPTTKDTFAAPAVVGSTTTSVDDGSVTTNWSLLSTAPAVTTNLETDPNVTGLGGWVAGTGTTSVTYDGSGLLATATQSSGGGLGYVNSAAYTVVAGRFYRFGVNVTAIDSWGSGTFGASFAVMVRWFSDTSATVQIGGDIVSSPVAVAQSASGDVQSAALTAPAGAVRAKVFPYTDRSPYKAVRWRINNRWVNECTVSAELRSGYFDGATTDTTAINYAWTGTVNASTSTATWTAPALAVVSGAVQGTVYGRASASIRRTATVTMSSLTYMRLRGTASAYSDGQITIADNGGGTLTPTSYSYNTSTGAYDILINRSAGFTAVDITFTRTGGSISTTTGLIIASDQIDITDNPFATGKVQTRQITIGGSQRTELSLSVLGLDAAGTTPVALGEQVLIHTAAKGTDGRAKFLAARSASGLAGTADATATSGSYTALPIVSGTPTAFTFPASTLLPGNYLIVARVMPATTGTKVINFRAFVDPSTGDNIYDPPGGTAWKTAPLAVSASGYPAIAQNAWGMIPLGVLALPPADLEDTGATLTIQIAADIVTVVRLDDLFLLNADVGQATLVNTAISGGSYSAVRLDAATVDSPDPAVFVGVANGTMVADQTRIQDFNQHVAKPGLLQVSSVTPGCSTSRLAGSNYRWSGHDVAPATS